MSANNLIKFDYEEMKAIRTELDTLKGDIEGIKGRLATLAVVNANEWTSKETAMYDTLMTHADKGVTTMWDDFGAVFTWNKNSADVLSELEEAVSSSLAKAYAKMFGN